MSYAYNDASQLTAMTYQLGATTLGNLTYAYDNAGRRVTTGGSFARTGLPLAVTATYNGANQLTQWGTATLTYDLNGNMTSSGSDGYTWDARNRLVSTLSGASFQYDPFGRRVSKTVAGVTTNFLYDGVNLVQELSGATPTANLLAGGIDEVFSRTDAAGARSFLSDALGSTLGLADPTGTLLTQYTYEPFGNTTVSGTSSNSFQFTGRENDGTGLYFYRARYYNPQFQRFISEDPLEFDGGDSNLYAYVTNSPANFTDPGGTIQPPKWPFWPRPRKPVPNKKCTAPPQPPTVGPGPKGLPPDPFACSPYLDGTGAGTGAGYLLFRLCMGFPDSPWSDCVRQKLLNQYVPNGNPFQLVWYLSADHFYDFGACLGQ